MYGVEVILPPLLPYTDACNECNNTLYTLRTRIKMQEYTVRRVGLRGDPSLVAWNVGLVTRPLLRGLVIAKPKWCTSLTTASMHTHPGDARAVVVVGDSCCTATV